MLAAQRQGPLGNVRSRLTSSWVAGECTQGAWEYLHWESAQWKKYTTNMVACPRCYELGSIKCLDGQARCTCSEGSSGWRSLFQGKDPFSGAFEDADSGAAAKKSAALFSTFATVCDSLRVENEQLSNRLIAAESDKAGLLAAAGGCRAAGCWLSAATGS